MAKGYSTGWKEFSELLDPNENENTTAQNLWYILTPFTKKTDRQLRGVGRLHGEARGTRSHEGGGQPGRKQRGHEARQHGGTGRMGKGRCRGKFRKVRTRKARLPGRSSDRELGMCSLGRDLVMPLGWPFPFPSFAQVTRELNKEHTHMCRWLTRQGSLTWK